MPAKRMRVFAGPNGSGKTTIIEGLRAEISFGVWEKISVKDNVLNISTAADSYLAADIAEFLRQEVLKNNLSFTYETVMSHKSKIDFFRKAIDNGYRVYLYFIATEDPEINLNLVNVRIAQNGHPVPQEVIKIQIF